MPEIAYALYVGIDWGTVTHQVAVLDVQRVPLGERAVAHEAVALQTLTEWLMELAGGDPARVAVALEVPRGAVVDTLLERGFHVFALNPKQLDRFRDRYTVAGAKDDRRDAFVLASALATDRPAFRALAPEDPLIIELREWSRVEDELREEWGRLASRLREQLHRFYPQGLALCPAADEAWFWALLGLAPTPAAAQRLRRTAVVTLLRQHRIRRLTADHVLATLQSPPLRVAPGTVKAASGHVALLVPRLELVDRQRRDCARRIERLLDTLATTGEHRGHRDVTILRSLPGVGRVVAATMLAEASRLLAARDYHGLRTQAGVAPVTRQSGKRLLVGMRYACNPRLRNALYYWGFISVRHDAHSRQHYQFLRGRGHSHGRALRGVVDRLLTVLMAMLAAQTTYDPARRPAILALAP
jgi:transposase